MSSQLAARIREARIKANLSQNQLAKLTGIAQSALHSLESGRTKMSTKLSELAKALNVSVEWLLREDASVSANALAEPAAADYWAETYGSPEANIANKFNQDEIPILATTAAENGHHMIIGEPIAATFRHPVQMGVKGACALYVMGDAMYPRYVDGELVYCVTTMSPAANQDMVLIRNDGLALICRLIKISYAERLVTYQQFNPNKITELVLTEIKEMWLIVGRR